MVKRANTILSYFQPQAKQSKTGEDSQSQTQSDTVSVTSALGLAPSTTARPVSESQSPADSCNSSDSSRYVGAHACGLRLSGQLLITSKLILLNMAMKLSTRLHQVLSLRIKT